MVFGAYDGGTLIDWSWVDDHQSEIWQRVVEHLTLVGWSLLWGLVFAIPSRCSHTGTATSAAPH